MHKDESSIAIGELDGGQYQEIVTLINGFFDKDESEYLDLNLSSWRALVLKAQESLIATNQPMRLVQTIREQVEAYLSCKEFSVQSNLYLRASRPTAPSRESAESIGWHRESFYGPGMEHSINCWVPIRGVNSKNALKYIPRTQELNESDIKLSQQKDSFTDQYSVGHKLGFLYKPKEIIAGVNVNNSKVMNVNVGEFSLFSGNLIHGSGVNKSNEIRFSIDFRIIRNEHLHLTKQSHHASGGKPYFENVMH